ncbi:MAG: modification methylase, partial [Endozoicomonadaceae bacterium]|nr:modification methylase [Endozoicomonadaceae bacterium]
YDGDTNKNLKVDDEEIAVIPLQGDGDFRSPECIEMLKEADIVVTNPPFSLFREYMAQLIKYDKKFIVLGNMNAISYKEIFPLIKDNKLWLGCNGSGHTFIKPDGSEHKLGFTTWWTNLDHKKRHDNIDSKVPYIPNNYPLYDNYNAINIDKVKDIPCDYDGYMGVPISFLFKLNPEEVEILGITKNWDTCEAIKSDATTKDPFLDGNGKYARLIIRRL